MTSKTAAALDRTWLVQRLHKPFPSNHIFGKDNPFAFGGGLRNGGLSPEAMDVLRPIFAFDYMGAAEFEFGAVPKALRGIAESSKRLVTGSLTIQLKDVTVGWGAKDKVVPEGSADVFYLCRKEHRGGVEDRIRELAARDYTLKEATHLPSTLRPQSKYDGETVGWLELNNGFMFFTDREMWAATCAIFGVEVPS